MYKIILLLLCLIPTLALAKKSYPPYPEVWGYDISDDVGANPTHLTPMLMNNGDYLFLYLKDGQGTLLHFFDNMKKKFADSKRYDSYLASQGGSLPPDVKGFVELKDNKIIDVATNYDAYLKYPNGHNRLHYNYIRRSHDFEDKNTDYKLSVIGIAPFCKADGRCENLAYFMAPQLIAFKDETFLAFDDNYYLFIRFDRDFKTKFKPQHIVKLDDTRELKSNFYVMPYSKVEYFFDHIVERYTGKYNADVNKQFLDYLFEEERKGNI